MTVTPLFGLTISILAYFAATQIHRKWQSPVTTPLLLAILILICFLKITGISYEDYYIGGSYLNTLIVPSTVALGIPLFQAFKLMKFHARSILTGVIIGAIVNTTLTALLAKAFGMQFFLAISLFPKSVTTAMAIGITGKMAGMTTITLVVVVATGILTSVIGPVLLDLFGIKDSVAKGIALGGTGHAIGTGAAMQIGQIEGAMAGLAIGITGLVYVIISPIIAIIILK
ncbi:membrane protein [Lactococcus hodotermopsidis]|uniref:Membrane protein n=1 Tax=Pseudolactococcus hodotermopsidis TaxID=2709157 RepID=A0A6A0BG21_9LACT|nr:LrgB family protein [Lactococcus hodotermopsidis]GFH43308.1 membrane protein [Lactococcus hodotermopsidis]